VRRAEATAGKRGEETVRRIQAERGTLVAAVAIAVAIAAVAVCHTVGGISEMNGKGTD